MTSPLLTPTSICMLTMLGPKVSQKYQQQVTSQRCYAGRHGYRMFVHWTDDTKREGGHAPTAANPLPFSSGSKMTRAVGCAGSTPICILPITIDRSLNGLT